MSRISNNFRWIITDVFFVIYFLYFIVFNRYHLIYLEQIQLFRFNCNYFSDFLLRPGGLSEFIGAFLTQFYLFPFAGASIITLAGIALYAITRYIFHKHQFAGVIWTLLPAVLLASLHSYHLYTLAHCIGLIVSLGFFAIIISVENISYRFLLVVIGWPLLYIFTGGYAIYAILLCMLNELLFRRGRLHVIILGIYLFLALFVPYLASHFIFYIKAGAEWTLLIPLFLGSPYRYILIILIAYIPFMLLVIKTLLIYTKGSDISSAWKWKSILAGTVILVNLTFVIIRLTYDRKTEILLGIDNCVQKADWDGVLKLSSESPVTNRMVIHFTNLALFKSGRMGDQLFHYRQGGSTGLWLDWSQDWIAAFFGGEIYYHLAYNSEAYRWAFEAMVAKGPNPRSLKRLVITSLIDNNIALAKKYLEVLDQSLFYRKWAQHYLTFVNHPESLREDKEISEKRYFEIHSDFISSDNFGVKLPQLLADHPDNRMVFEYYMASLLLDKNLGEFVANVYRLKELGYTSVPVHYEEAMLAYMSMTGKNIVPEGYTISLASRNRLSDYVSTINSFENNMKMAARSMYGKFGKTYWYYLEFINNQP
ncbi:MAG TPA: DUF6057 family protein [Bacteroidales bacterium]|nr:DUF6057 family protein [Bacteroidales bacterium]